VALFFALQHAEGDPAIQASPSSLRAQSPIRVYNPGSGA
jgi:hypothetical protein